MKKLLRLCTVFIALFVITPMGKAMTGESAPPAPIVYHTVSQPSGETFKIKERGDYPPFKAGDVASGVAEDNSYPIFLAEDGYWYYMYNMQERITIKDMQNQEPDKEIVVHTEEEEQEVLKTYSLYNKEIEYIYEPKDRYLIDPLPDEIYTYVRNFTKRTTTEEEKETMAEMIAAERRRLRKEELTTTGEEPVESVISDPGPELFITVPVEGTESQPAAVTEQPAEATSEPAQTEHTEEEPETQSAPETTTAGEPSEPAVTAAGQTETNGRQWMPLAWAGGILLLLVGCGIGFLYWKRRRKKAAGDDSENARG